MRTTQYVRQERAIVAADSGGIRERWLWGLRILRDPEAMTASGLSLRHGVTEELIHAAAKVGLKLIDREVRRRIQCARTYKTEAEIGHAVSDFETWHDLVAANFPAYETPGDEPPADHRTQQERDHARAQALLDLVGPQGTLFPDEFEPTEATLKDLQDYTDEMETLTGKFVARDQKRRAYLDQLIKAAGNDLSVTWEAANALLPEPEPLEPEQVPA